MNLGDSGVYISDTGFKHLIDIPAEVALKWVQAILPEKKLGYQTKAKDITLETIESGTEGWLNKFFVIVGCENNTWVALYKADAYYSIRIKDL